MLEQRTRLKGASAIIEKDYAAARLAELTEADTLLFLTVYDKLTVNAGKPDERSFENVTVADLKPYATTGDFGPITTLPKVNAAIEFVEAGTGRKAVIANLEHAKDALLGRCGTSHDNI